MVFSEDEKENGEITAVFLAAGDGTRFGNSKVPKALIRVGSKTLIEHALSSLSKAGIKKAVIIAGYKKEKIKEKIKDSYSGISVQYAENDNYLSTETMHSLYKAKDMINSDIILLEADLLFEPSLINKIIESKYKDALVLADLSGSGDEVFISSLDGKTIEKMGKKIENKSIIGEFIGISKLSENYLKELFDCFGKELRNKEEKRWCEDVFLEFSKRAGKPLYPFLVKDLIWTEIDTKEDLKKAREIIFPKFKLNLPN